MDDLEKESLNQLPVSSVNTDLSPAESTFRQKAFKFTIKGIQMHLGEYKVIQPYSVLFGSKGRLMANIV